jgi:hypothetical protein
MAVSRAARRASVKAPPSASYCHQDQDALTARDECRASQLSGHKDEIVTAQQKDWDQRLNVSTAWKRWLGVFLACPVSRPHRLWDKGQTLWLLVGAPPRFDPRRGGGKSLKLAVV